MSFLAGVGLDYLTLDRTSGSLSGGEGQRIRLATQIGSSLVGVLYILDEPSIGLHQRDNQRLLATLKRLQELGNSVLVVEHDRDTMVEADHIVDMGPGAGIHGGYVVAQGTPREVMRNPRRSPASICRAKSRFRCRRGAASSAIAGSRCAAPRENNLHDITVAFPLGVVVCVTGVSGSGKSTLVLDTLHRALAQKLGAAASAPAFKGARRRRASRQGDPCRPEPDWPHAASNPATYTGLSPISANFRAIARSPDARLRPGRFSFNVKGGRCEACQGDGIIRIEMHFLPDVYVTCEVCNGKRYNRDTLEIQYKGKNIAEVLD